MKTYDLNLLVALDALLATGSVTAAAERVHLSTPAMSHALARIREVFGDAILVRAGRQLVPTPRALALAEPVRQLLAQARALQSPGEGPGGLAQVRRHFVVRAPEGMAVVYGAALSQAIAQQMPLASLQFLAESHSDPAALREGRVDLDVGVFRSRDPEVEWQELSQQPLVGAARAGHPLLAKPLTPARLAAVRHVGVTLRPGEPSTLDDALAALGLERMVALRVPSAFAALIAAARSDLVACVPERVARSDLVACVPERVARGMSASLRLEVFALPLALQSDTTRMAWHPRYSADAAHRWLRECLLKVLEDPLIKGPDVKPPSRRRRP
ncbi:DNA-binding transcriptional LysR family regulator [Acidovorax soli]|uniref:DNA-binding transcriptional LysR family regulator n=1 Tax=Acidovorax soli TaxID=592050 RepID=A0A7X0PL21_9BURK|nr:LysR family transcriptional regulator [Acidovorax soli]MBB6563361.1 DNA-binding transcriptional LysR family regulator [Acidovorax soli]